MSYLRRSLPLSRSMPKTRRLKDGWLEITPDEGGAPYFWHKGRNETTWDKPDGIEPVPKTKQPVPAPDAAAPTPAPAPAAEVSATPVRAPAPAPAPVDPIASTAGATPAKLRPKQPSDRLAQLKAEAAKKRAAEAAGKAVAATESAAGGFDAGGVGGGDMLEAHRGGAVSDTGEDHVRQTELAATSGAAAKLSSVAKAKSSGRRSSAERIVPTPTEEAAILVPDPLGFKAPESAVAAQKELANKQQKAYSDARTKWFKWLKKCEAAGRLDGARVDEEEVKLLLKLGVPHELRRQIWPVLSGALRTKGMQQADDTGWGPTGAAISRGASCPAHQVIAKTLQQGGPMLCRHAVYDVEAGRQRLEQLLKMISLRMHLRQQTFAPAQSLLAGVVLVTVGTLMPNGSDVEDEAGTAFWVLASILDKFPPNYYGAVIGPGATVGPSSVVTEVQIFLELAQERYGKIIDHWQSIGLGMGTIQGFFTPWFAQLFIHVLAWPALLRFLDCLMVEGVKAVHRLGLTLLDRFSRTLMTLGTEADVKRELVAGVAAMNDPTDLIKTMLEVKLMSRDLDQRRERLRVRAQREFSHQAALEQQQQQQQQQQRGGGGGWGAAMGAVRQQGPQPGQQQPQLGGLGGWGRALGAAGLNPAAVGGGGGGGASLVGLAGVVSAARQQQSMGQPTASGTELSAQAAEVVREAHRMAESIRAMRSSLGGNS